MTRNFGRFARDRSRGGVGKFLAIIHSARKFREYRSICGEIAQEQLLQGAEDRVALPAFGTFLAIDADGEPRTAQMQRNSCPASRPGPR
jgi:hypothetical protein